MTLTIDIPDEQTLVLAAKCFRQLYSRAQKHPVGEKAG
jgi:hypothetical protein